MQAGVKERQQVRSAEVISITWKAIDAVGGPRKFPCENRHLADGCALQDSGDSTRTRNHVLPSFEIQAHEHQAG